MLSGRVGKAMFWIVLPLIAVVGAAAAFAEEPSLDQAAPPAAVQAAVSSEEEPAAAASEEGGEIEVEVVGKREGLLSISPAPGEVVEAVSAKEIADTGAPTVLEAIQFTPSVYIRHQGARYEQRLSIRGFPPRLVLLDGIPIAREGYSGAGALEAGFAGRILYTLPTDIVERIDVIRSAGTIVYGSTTSTGAVVNIVTKEPTREEASLSVEAGSFDRLRYGLTAAGLERGWGYLLDGRRDVAASNLPLGDKAFTDGFVKIVKNYPSGSKLLLDFFSLDGSRTLDLSQDVSIVPARYWEINPWREHFLNLVYSHALDAAHTLDLVVYGRDRDFTTCLFKEVTFQNLQRYWEESEDDQGLDLRYSARGQGGDLLRLGLQYAKSGSDTLDIRYGKQTQTILTRDDRTTRSAFACYTHPLRPDLRLTAGLRYDDPDDFGGEMTYSVGLEQDVSPRTQFHAHYGRGAGFPIPTAGDVQRGTILPVERSQHVDIGWTLRPDPNRIAGLGLFWSKIRDGTVLYNDPAGSIGPDAWYAKVEDIETYGLECTYQQRWRRGEWFANYTFLERDVTNRKTPLIPGPDYPRLDRPPKHLGAIGLTRDVGKTRFTLTGKWSDSYLAQSRMMATAFPVDAYFVLDLRVRRQLRSGELSLLVDNLLNTSYETMPAFPRPGRNYLVSYKWAL
jgi:outer membrane receptor protein involved in Fe transport